MRQSCKYGLTGMVLLTLVLVGTLGTNRWINVDDPRSDRGPSAFHRTHRAVFSYTYEFPKFKD